MSPPLFLKGGIKIKIRNLFSKNKSDAVDSRCLACGLDESCLSPRMPISGKGAKSILVLGEGPGCVSGETLIETAFRNKSKHLKGIPIKDLVGKKDFLVYSYNIKTNKMVLGEVKKVWKVGRKKIWKVTYTWKFCEGQKVITKQNSIEVTSNHPFLIKKGIPHDPFKGVDCNQTYLSLDQGLTIGHSLQPFHRTFWKYSFIGAFSKEKVEEFPPIDNHKITEIQYIGVHPVYDMEVEEYHNFAANGIFVHNSQEDEKNTQWVGKAGDFLRKSLRMCDINLDRDCWKFNALSCRCTKGKENRKPTKKEITFCRYRVFDVIKKHKPKYIMLFGGVAVESVLGYLFPKLDISKVHGYAIPIQEYNAWVLPLYHPSFIMRSEKDENLQSTFKRDVKNATDFINQGKEVPRHDYITNLDNVHLLLDIQDVRSAFKQILKTKKETAFDYETTGTKPFVKGQKITSMAISIESGTYSFPVDYQTHWNDKEFNIITDLIIKYLEDDSIFKVAHGAKFEKMWSQEIFEVRPKVDWCSMDTQHIIDHRRGVTSLKFQAFVRWGIHGYDRLSKAYIKSNSGSSFNRMDEMPLGNQLLYVSLDAKLTRELFFEQKKQVTKELEPGRKLFLDTSDVFLDMQMNGLAVDEEHYKTSDKDLTTKINTFTKQIAHAPEVLQYKKTYGKAFSETSPKDLQILLFEDMGIPSSKKTSGGSKSVDAEVLGEINHPIPKAILLKRKYLKLRDTYLAQFLRECTDGFMHPNFNLNMARSLRSCLAKGTKILVVRDFEKHPEGVPIEEIKKGDYVYCFDDNLNPTIQKVLWAGKTGHRKTIRIHYTRHRKELTLNCTPEHRIRMIDGSYVEAQNLMEIRKQNKLKGPCHHALAGGRHGDELYFTGHLKHNHGIKEHRFIYSELIDFLTKNEVVHHKNENHFDHTPSNLEAMTKSKHSFLHAKKRMNLPETKVWLSILMKNRWASGELKKYIRRGKGHSNYLGLTKWNCLRLLAKVGGKIKHLIGDFYIDTATFQKYLDEHKIDRKLVKLRYDKNGKYISKGRLIKLAKLGRAEVSKILGHNYYKLLDLYKFYGINTKRKWGNQCGPFIPGNHAIVKIENLERSEDVYDIEVEKFHNFFANELCVHNSASNPSFQNIPKRDEESKYICRRGIIPSVGCKLLESDFAGIEVSTSAIYHKDPVFINYLISDDADMHRDLTLQLWNIPKNQITKTLRFFTKNCWTFPQFYGDFFGSCATALWKMCVEGNLKLADGTPLMKHLRVVKLHTLELFTQHCKDVEEDMWYRRFKVYTEWKEDINDFYQRHGYVETFFGFRFTDYLNKKQTTNYPIQSTATHLLFWCLCRLQEIAIIEDWRSCQVGQIHDSQVSDTPDDEVAHVIKTINHVCSVELAENFEWIDIPMKVDFEISKLREDGGNFAEMEEYKL